MSIKKELAVYEHCLTTMAQLNQVISEFDATLSEKMADHHIELMDILSELENKSNEEDEDKPRKGRDFL